MKSVVIANSHTGEVNRLEVASGLSVRELKVLLLQEIPSLRGCVATAAELQLRTEQGRRLCNEETVGDEGERKVGEGKEMQEVEEMRLFVKVHRRLPVVCRGCSRSYDLMTAQEADAVQRNDVIDGDGDGDGGDEVDEVDAGRRKEDKDDENEEAVTTSPCLLQCGHSICLNCMRRRLQVASAETSTSTSTSVSAIRESREVRCGRTSSWISFISQNAVVPHTAMEEHLRRKRQPVDMESADLCWSVDGNGNGGSTETIAKESTEPMESTTKVNGSEDEVINESNENVDVDRSKEGDSGEVNNNNNHSPLENLKEQLETAHQSWLGLHEELHCMAQAQLDHWEQLSMGLGEMFDAMEQRLKELRESTRLELRNRHVIVEMSLQKARLSVSRELGNLKMALMECEDLLVLSPTMSMSADSNAGSVSEAHADIMGYDNPRAVSDRFMGQKAEARRLSSPVDASFVFEGIVSGLRECLSIPAGMELVKSTAKTLQLRMKYSPFDKSSNQPKQVDLSYREDSSEVFIHAAKLPVIGVDGIVTLRNLKPLTTYIVQSSVNPSVMTVARTRDVMTREKFVNTTTSTESVEIQEAVCNYEEQFQNRPPTSEDIEILMRMGQYFETSYDCWSFGKSKRYFALCADLGHVPAKIKLAYCSSDPTIILLELAEQGCVEVYNHLGMLYSKGTGTVKADAVEAMKWFRRGADEGDRYAQHNLGWNFEKGIGVQQNRTEALRWYEKSASQGSSGAMIRLGRIYEKGVIVAKDDVKAKEFYRSALKAGNKEAEKYLMKLFGLNLIN